MEKKRGRIRKERERKGEKKNRDFPGVPMVEARRSEN